jgi:hypothetical protein
MKVGDGDDPSPAAGVELRTRPQPFALPTFLYSPWLSFDGMLKTRFGWAKEFVSLSPGKHTLSCGLGNEIGDSVDVVVPQNGVVSVRWRGPAVVGGNGKWTILDEPNVPDW